VPNGYYLRKIVFMGSYSVLTHTSFVSVSIYRLILLSTNRWRSWQQTRTKLAAMDTRLPRTERYFVPKYTITVLLESYTKEGVQILRQGSYHII
jgi:hypothetical protein